MKEKNHFYLVENNNYKCGTMITYGENLFVVSNIAVQGSLLFLRASEVENFRWLIKGG